MLRQRVGAATGHIIALKQAAGKGKVQRSWRRKAFWYTIAEISICVPLLSIEEWYTTGCFARLCAKNAIEAAKEPQKISNER